MSTFSIAIEGPRHWNGWQQQRGTPRLHLERPKCTEMLPHCLPQLDLSTRVIQCQKQAQCSIRRCLYLLTRASNHDEAACSCDIDPPCCDLICCIHQVLLVACIHRGACIVRLKSTAADKMHSLLHADATCCADGLSHGCLSKP